MRTLEHRRHSRRDPTGTHLNAAGRSVARSIGAGLAPFDRVVTSPRPRAIETAEAMGRSVDVTLAELAEMPDEAGVPMELFQPRTFSDYAEMIRQSSVTAAYAARQAELWRTELERVPDDGSLLMISHGGIIELGALAAVPRIAPSWGSALRYMEGVRLRWDGRRWTTGDVLRVPD
ncbi:MAG: histidine phosphatase family protein [Thermoplasmata archaeon]|nr:histidine phosphatase family protein [Thermoplasmata archaeon]